MGRGHRVPRDAGSRQWEPGAAAGRQPESVWVPARLPLPARFQGGVCGVETRTRREEELYNREKPGRTSGNGHQRPARRRGRCQEHRDQEGGEGFGCLSKENSSEERTRWPGRHQGRPGLPRRARPRHPPAAAGPERRKPREGAPAPVRFLPGRPPKPKSGKAAAGLTGPETTAPPCPPPGRGGAGREAGGRQAAGRSHPRWALLVRDLEDEGDGPRRLGREALRGPAQRCPANSLRGDGGGARARGAGAGGGFRRVRRREGQWARACGSARAGPPQLPQPLPPRPRPSPSSRRRTAPPPHWLPGL